MALRSSPPGCSQALLDAAACEQGILFHDRMKAGMLDRVRPQLVQLEEQFIAANPDVPVRRVPAPKVFKGF